MNKSDLKIKEKVLYYTGSENFTISDLPKKAGELRDNAFYFKVDVDVSVIEYVVGKVYTRGNS